ncbi:MAG: Hpt domain-containing protein [Verrucomicrobiae bacterium]|nr:Hpt domain-containing protein [Verrucomicrobiae bacterium]
MELIDWEQFEGIVDFSDSECVEIYEEFAEELPVHLAALRTACAASDSSQAAELAHRLRGSCLTFGLVEVSEILRQLETDGKAGNDLSPELWEQRLPLAAEGSLKSISLRKNG